MATKQANLKMSFQCSKQQDQMRMSIFNSTSVPWVAWYHSTPHMSWSQWIGKCGMCIFCRGQIWQHRSLQLKVVELVCKWWCSSWGNLEVVKRNPGRRGGVRQRQKEERETTASSSSWKDGFLCCYTARSSSWKLDDVKTDTLFILNLWLQNPWNCFDERFILLWITFICHVTKYEVQEI